MVPLIRPSVCKPHFTPFRFVRRPRSWVRGLTTLRSGFSMICPDCSTDKPKEAFQRVRRGVILCYPKCKKCLRAESKRRKLFRKQRGATYESRNAILRAIGFRSYSEYLQSDLWKRIRAKVFRVKGRFCMLCSRPADVPHHNRYHRHDLLGWTLKYINPLCNKCHHEIEFLGDKKVPLKSAAETYRALRKGRTH